MVEYEWYRRLCFGVRDARVNLGTSALPGYGIGISCIHCSFMERSIWKTSFDQRQSHPALPLSVWYVLQAVGASTLSVTFLLESSRSLSYGVQCGFYVAVRKGWHHAGIDNSRDACAMFKEICVCCCDRLRKTDGTGLMDGGGSTDRYWPHLWVCGRCVD